jgi:hypothetical protein
MAPNRKLKTAKAKAKKQKVLAIGGAVLLIAILAYEIPNTMKLMSPSKSAATTTTTTASTPPSTGTAPPGGSLIPPTLSGSAPAPTTGSASGLVNSDLGPATADGHLGKLDQFVAKDPFKQQLAVTGGSTGTTPTTPTTTIPSAPVVPPVAPPVLPIGPTVPPITTTPGPTPPVANRTIATITVNDVPEDVQVGATFPKAAAQPYFQLVALGTSSVKIGIAGGSLAGGNATVTLVKGKKLTLMNTADGTKYVLKLVALK